MLVLCWNIQERLGPPSLSYVILCKFVHGPPLQDRNSELNYLLVPSPISSFSSLLISTSCLFGSHTMFCGSVSHLHYSIFTHSIHLSSAIAIQSPMPFVTTSESSCHDQALIDTTRHPHIPGCDIVAFPKHLSCFFLQHEALMGLGFLHLSGCYI
jgi:hypothetical protein